MGLQYSFEEFKGKHVSINKWHTFWLHEKRKEEIIKWCLDNCLGDFCVKVAPNRTPPQNLTLIVSERKDRIKINKDLGKLWGYYKPHNKI